MNAVSDWTESRGVAQVARGCSRNQGGRWGNWRLGSGDEGLNPGKSKFPLGVSAKSRSLFTNMDRSLRSTWLQFVWRKADKRTWRNRRILSHQITCGLTTRRFPQNLTRKCSLLKNRANLWANLAQPQQVLKVHFKSHFKPRSYWKRYGYQLIRNSWRPNRSPHSAIWATYFSIS